MRPQSNNFTSDYINGPNDFGVAYDPIYNDTAVMDLSNRNNVDPQVMQYIKKLETRNAELMRLIESHNSSRNRKVIKALDPAFAHNRN